MEKITIYHVNDFHSHLERWPKITSFLQEKRMAHQAAGETCFVFDIGDAVDRVHPLMEATDGQAMTRLLNQTKIDAATIGNNEGLGNSKEQLNQLYKEANFPVVLSNFKDTNTNHSPQWAVPWRVLQTKQRQRIGVFGLTVPLNINYQPLGWVAEDPFQTVEHMLDRYSELSDTIILLSHLGLEMDREIARLYPKIDLIIGSHTHHLLSEGERVGQTLLTGAGKFGEFIGETTIELDQGRVQSLSTQVIETDALDQVPKEKESIDYYEQLGRQLLSEKPVANLPETLPIQWNECGPFVQIVLDAVKEYAETEAVMLNAGLLLRPLLAGIVKKNDLHETMPHTMRIVKVTMSGEEMTQFLNSFQEKQTALQNKEFFGIGFRGKILGKFCFAGVDFDEEKETWLFQEEPIQEQKSYTFSTVDHFIFANHFPLLKETGKKEILFPDLLRNVVERHLKKKYPLQ